MAGINGSDDCLIPPRKSQSQSVVSRRIPWKTRPELVGRSAVRRLRTDLLPEEFNIIVVFGPSGSGKTTILQQLAKHFRFDQTSTVPAWQEDWPRQRAVVSHPDFVSKATGEHQGLDLLQCVGLNRVPAWIRPFHVLSNGERSRASCALRLARGTGMVEDDYAAMVDNQTASSMACSLRRLVVSGKAKRILLATTRAVVLSYLQPDWVIFAETGAVVQNPWKLDERDPRPTFEGAEDLVFVKKGSEGVENGVVSGWTSASGASPDNRPVVHPKSPQELGAGSRRVPRAIQGGVEHYERQCDVECDEICHEVARAFDTDLTWMQPLCAIRTEALPVGYFLGAIIGPSGAGKTSALERMVPGSTSASGAGQFDSSLPLSQQVCIELLDALGLPRVCWCRPYRTLSSSEQAIAEIARLIMASSPRLKGSLSPICIDEFTTLLDRTVARRVCLGLAKLVRSRHLENCRLPPIIVSTVHEDVLPWLLPDWVFLAGTGQLIGFEGAAPTCADVDVAANCAELVSRPTVRELLKPAAPMLTVQRLVGPRESRQLFKDVFQEHHYMRGDAPCALYGILVRCEGEPVAFHGVAQQVGVGQGTVTMRESRLVVLPRFQGFGIGPRLSDLVGRRLLASGMRFMSKTHHPRLGQYRQNSKLWRPSKTNGMVDRSRGMCANKKRVQPQLDRGQQRLAQRQPFCHQFIGDVGDGNDHLVEALRGQKRRRINYLVPTAADKVGNPHEVQTNMSTNPCSFLHWDARPPIGVLVPTEASNFEKVHEDVPNKVGNRCKNLSPGARAHDVLERTGRVAVSSKVRTRIDRLVGFTRSEVSKMPISETCQLRYLLRSKFMAYRVQDAAEASNLVRTYEDHPLQSTTQSKRLPCTSSSREVLQRTGRVALTAKTRNRIDRWVGLSKSELKQMPTSEWMSLQYLIQNKFVEFRNDDNRPEQTSHAIVIA